MDDKHFILTMDLEILSNIDYYLFAVNVFPNNAGSRKLIPKKVGVTSGDRPFCRGKKA